MRPKPKHSRKEPRGLGKYTEPLVQAGALVRKCLMVVTVSVAVIAASMASMVLLFLFALVVPTLGK